MKILHFTTSVSAGGAETMLCNLVEQHSRQGIESVVVSTAHQTDEKSLISRLSRVSQVIHLPADSLASTRFWRPFSAIVAREKPDVIQTWMHTSGPAVSIITKLVSSFPVVWGVHSKEFLRFPSVPILRHSLGRLLGLSAQLLPSSIVSCSQTAIDLHAERYGYPRRKMHWIANGIDTGRFRPEERVRLAARKRLGISPETPLIGMVSRLDPVKDIPSFLRAAAIVQAARKDVHLALCGCDKDKLNAEERSLCANLPDAQRLHWLGFQRDMETVYPAFDLHTLTSQSEAYPMVLIESMACGVPNITTDAGDASLILDRWGTVVPPGDHIALAKAWMQHFEQAAATRQELSCRVREHALQNFSLQRCANRYRDLYETLAS